MSTTETSLSGWPVSRKFPAQAIHAQAEGASLTLRPLRLSDAEQVEQAQEESRPALKAYMAWAHAASSMTTQLERRRLTEADYFAGRDMQMGLFSSEGTLLVACGLHFRVPLNPSGVEFGYWTRTRFSRQGFATRALQLMTLYAFDKLGCDRAQVLHNQENVASQRVIEKAGFQFEGTLRNCTAAPSAEQVMGGHVTSRRSLQWALLPDDLPGLPWVAPLRASLRYVNMLGHAL